MAGIVMIFLGILLIAGATAGILTGNHIINAKKKRIREEVYQIYD